MEAATVLLRRLIIAISSTAEREETPEEQKTIAAQPANAVLLLDNRLVITADAAGPPT